MISQKDAAEIAAQELSQLDLDVVLFDEPMASGDYGWVFGYQSAKYVASGEMSDMLAGNAPLLVDRTTGLLHVLGTAYDLNVYISNYVAFADPHRFAGQ
jgi:hypothetical protein